jgi:hypothetical protein
MNWKLILLLSLFGLALGFATVSFIPSTVEPICWLVIFIVSSIAIAKKARGKYFLHGFAVSVINGIWLTAVHLLFFDAYVAGHPEFTEMLAGSGTAGNPKLFMAISGPIIGALFGVVLGGLAWIASKLFKKI